jgi:hypothetical protein
VEAWSILRSTAIRSSSLDCVWSVGKKGLGLSLAVLVNRSVGERADAGFERVKRFLHDSGERRLGMNRSGDWGDLRGVLKRERLDGDESCSPSKN